MVEHIMFVSPEDIFTIFILFNFNHRAPNSLVWVPTTYKVVTIFYIIYAACDW